MDNKIPVKAPLLTEKEEEESQSCKTQNPESTDYASKLGGWTQGIWNTLGDMKIPKEIVSQLLLQTDKTKKDLLDVIGREFARFLREMKFNEMLLALVENMTVEIHTQIQIRATKDGGLQMHVENIKKKEPKKKEA